MKECKRKRKDDFLFLQSVLQISYDDDKSEYYSYKVTFYVFTRYEYVILPSNNYQFAYNRLLVLSVLDIIVLKYIILDEFSSYLTHFSMTDSIQYIICCSQISHELASNLGNVWNP